MGRQDDDLSARPDTIWPPNGKLVPVTVNYEVSDNCGTVSSALQVSSNDPTAPASDWVVVDAHHLLLRVARNADGSARIYTITVTATNASGGTSTAVTTVEVPRNRGNDKRP